MESVTWLYPVLCRFLSDVLNGCVSALDNLCKLTKLRQLDVSQGDDGKVYFPVVYKNPSDRLKNLVSSMPNLTSLDISGTNLARFTVVQPVSHRLMPKNGDGTMAQTAEKQECCIAGLEGRQFEFLGLLDCSDDASHQKRLPAKKVSGDANEEQVMTSLHVYRDKPSLLSRALKNLLELFRNDKVNAQCFALEGILSGMERNKHSRHVQIHGSASLVYLVKGEQKHQITQIQKMRICNCVLDAMERHKTEHMMMRNGCDTLLYFNIPDEVMFCYSRLVQIILNLMRTDFDDDSLRRMGLFLLRRLSRNVEGKHKQAHGDLGTIKVMCDIIKQRLDRQVCDGILKASWHTLCNVTDKTPRNCERFMDEGGMYLFIHCVKEFPDEENLLNNMMIVMGNIAEVAELRPSLRIPEYVKVMCDIIKQRLDRQVCDGILKASWGTLCNVTDKTPRNCERFMDEGGMYLFLHCVKEFPDKDDLLNYMMFVMGKIAAVAELRPSLMIPEYVKVMCDIIKQRLDRQVCDVILVQSWSTLCTLTDETPRNCERFMDEGGMYLFLHCVKEFPDKDDLLNYMMFVMGNIAEVAELRPSLMIPEYVKVMCDIIKQRLDRQVCDEILVQSWSTLCTLTDETPRNCERFMDEGGMYLFLHCVKEFPDKDDLLNYMMFVMGNIAEVAELRPSLMIPEYVKVMCDIIKQRLDRQVCDVILVQSWSTLCTLTDKTPRNCERFMDEGGMHLFRDCVKEFPDKDDLLLAMMIVMGKIAAVAELRPSLMIPEYVKVMCDIIKQRLDRQVCDVILVQSWSTLCTLTDKTPRNCERFMDEGGMYLFLHCIKEFPDKDDLLNNMMIVMGNIAAVAELRPSLKIPEYVKVMCDIIKQRLDRQVCDVILEMSWHTLCSVTDKTPRNCERFMDEGGMHLFRDCVKEFPDKEDLLHNMMIVMGNIAEVAELRPSLMIPEYVKVMCDIIKQRLDRQVCDGILELSWSTLCSVTDETPRNCERFMDEGGMHLFLHCVNEFPDKDDLLNNMMIVMGNIAEVAELRPSLMIPEYVKVMCDIIKQRLDRQVCDGILKASWGTLCNVTDKTPRNCERFMDEGGMYLFIHCVKEFPDKENLLNNMMIVMGNIAEVAELRPSLRIPEYVKVMCDIIKQRLDRQVCDVILEWSWITLCNVTDKTPRNCERFMDEGGMYLFLHCVKEFPDKEDLLINMMIVMGNIAEVAELRPSLMIPEYVKVMFDIIKQRLDRQVCDGILVQSWGILGYVTDKTPRNCERFMDEGGMHLFRDCVKEFPDKERLLRNMMGVMGNIAAVAELRPSLMILEYVKVMCDIIKQRLDRQVCDVFLVHSWGTLCNVTDKTPRNCERFMDEGGMHLFRDCVKEFPDKEGLLNNMMFVMGNIAEVAELRPSLMIPEYVKVMCDIIKQRLDRQVCDGILEMSWHTLCSVTDKTPRNCERFMDEGGMHLFLHCIKEFPDKEALLNNMMIVMGNIAEVAELRPSLMIPEYVKVMFDIIKQRLDRQVCDVILERSWITLCSVTDETPRNCERFMDEGGMHLFLHCVKEFPDQERLLHNMMVVMGNIAAVAELRPSLMIPEYVKVMFDIIKQRLDRQLCDGILELSWFTLCSVTDKTPRNCERFMDEGGMHLFLHCVKEFPDKEGLLRNMMIVMGHIAEVAELRPSLMIPEYVKVMCDIIKQRLDRQVCDVILVQSWRTLCSVTDETPRNCERFMDEGGMHLFLHCVKEFPDKEGLLRNMMFVMANIAEVAELRPSLMTPEYVTVFSDLLDSTKDGIEVSYNAAGVVGHMLSDGPDSWTVSEPTRNQVIHRMVFAIKRWPLDSKRKIYYSSFMPILRLVRCFESHASQYWAIWALCNLTQVYPEKYCKLLQDEGGMELLDAVTRDPRPIDAIKLLATQTIEFIRNRDAQPKLINGSDFELVPGEVDDGIAVDGDVVANDADE